MAEKISMIIVVVDLDCHKCYNKIRKILCQLQDHERIRTISFDNKSKTITIVGPFDPHKLGCKLRCKGGKVVRDIHIVENGGGKPPKMMMAEQTPSPAPLNNGKPKKAKPPAAEPPPPAPTPAPEPEQVQEIPPPPSPAHPAPHMSATMPSFVEEDPKPPPAAVLEPPPMSPPRKRKPMPMAMPMPTLLPPPQPVDERPSQPPPCRPVEQPPMEYVIPTVEIPSWPAPPVGPCGCPCCAPCYQGCYESCRCCYCGRAYSCAVTPKPLPPCGYRGCRTFSDEDPTAACSIM